MKDYMMALHQRFCKEPECREVRKQIAEAKRDLRLALDRRGQEQRACEALQRRRGK